MMVDSHAAVLAVVAGQPLTEMPRDLFIPPDALEVLLDSFSGPLDLLLYLIRQQDIDILNIPMVTITRQYMQYIELLEERRLELAADYLVMAALLAEIKSKLLLPVSSELEEGVESDPRMELVRRLQAYEQFKLAASLIDKLPRFDRDVFQVRVHTVNIAENKKWPDVELTAVMTAMVGLMARQERLTNHQIARELLSVRERMSMILQYLQHEKLMGFTQLLHRHEGRMGLVVTFLAILELAKQSLVTITQTTAYSSMLLASKSSWMI